jgi:uncharacterized damage-inducible protein DinB
MKSLLLNYLQYNHWANEKMCNYLSGVDEAEIVANKKAEYQTIKKVILHIADAEQTWLARLNGKNIPHMHNLDATRSFADICKQSETTQQILSILYPDKKINSSCPVQNISI